MVAHPEKPLAVGDFAALATPALTVDLGRLEVNIAATAAEFSAAGVSLRPHFKTSKCVEVARRQRAAGAIGFTCSTPAEVELLLGEGFSGLLWAHLPVGAPKVQAAIGFAARGVRLIVDSVAVAAPLSAAADEMGIDLPVFLEINTGQGRTGVDPELAVALARQISELPRMSIVGVLTHEGHLAAYLGDRDALEVAGRGVGTGLAAVADDLRAAGFAIETVSVGSTPGMTSAPFAEGVTEGRPGTYVYFDANQWRLGSTSLGRCASSVLTRVVSVNRPGTAIIDAGLKAMSADALTPENGGGIVVDLAGYPLPELTFSTANEEHGFLVGPGTATLAVGDLLRVIPNHACGTSNMWSSLLAVGTDGSVERWEIQGRH